MARVYVAAGSNIDPQANLTRAEVELARIFGALQVSPWYRNAAVGFTGEDFINFVFGFETALSVHDTQAQLREVEMRCGRPRKRWRASTATTRSRSRPAPRCSPGAQRRAAGSR